MLALLSDTHSHEDIELTDSVAETLSSASIVAHAGDLTTQTVLNQFEERAERFVAVSGNSDNATVTERLPDWKTFTYEGYRFLVTHGHHHNSTSLSLLARQEEADVVVVGHTHRAELRDKEDLLVINPGSHADPRGREATMATVTHTGVGLCAQIQTIEGQPRERVNL
ncbi:metallophosphoesterase [Halovenus rubra]|uniref:Metallophosphoesterase n=2 Tax=Halovenus rubra TaxID=869890 RepID=A0ACC7E6D6_9EURY|nr:metallophosphoesterase [Halovenus rubra]